jgi:hypothetical protein
MNPFNLSQRIARTPLVLQDFGAVGDNVTDDTAALTAAINAAQARQFTPSIYLGGGLFNIAGSLPNLTEEIIFVGDGPHASALMLSNPITIKGITTRAADVQFKSLTIGGYAMTSGYAVDIDWAQDVTFENVVMAHVWNGVKIRQAGGVRFQEVLVDVVRGAVGIDIMAYDATRNGEVDSCDLTIFDGVVIQSTLPAVGGTNSAVMLRLDGRVHTVQCDGLRLLNGGVGLQTLNTAALPSHLVPRFILGSSIEVENMYGRCLDLVACREFNPDYLFAANSHTQDVIYLSAGCSGFAPSKLAVSTGYLCGIFIAGATDTRLLNPLIYNNSIVGLGAKPAVFIQGSGTVTIDGGLIGKNSTLPAYTEPQSGVLLDAAYNGVLIMRGVDLRGNQSFALGDTGLTAAGSSVTNCPGYNPRGAALQTVGASPYVYTAGLSPESVNLYNGSGVVATIGGVAMTTTVPAAFTLQPRQTVSISYATIPTMAVNKG